MTAPTPANLLAPAHLAHLKQAATQQPAAALRGQPQALYDLVPQDGQAPDWQACLQALPDLALLAATPQDARHHGEGDVWTHTRMVLQALLQGPAWQAADTHSRFILFMAALLHDIAKPATTTVDPASGHIGQPGHSARGAVDARILLWRCGLPFATREAICRLIAVHQVPFFAFAHNRAGHSPEYLARKLSHEVRLRHLCALAEADMRGRIAADQQTVLDDIALFAELAQEEGCYDQPYPFADAWTRLRYCAGEAVDPASVYHHPGGSRVIVMHGLPASGKDHWVRQHAGQLPVVSFDGSRAALGLRHGQNDGLAAHHAIDQAKTLLRQKAPFVWNATHLSRQMRGKTLDLLHAYHAITTIVYLEQPEPVLLARNRARDSTLSNAALLRMLHRWEVALPAEAHDLRVQVPETSP